MARPTLYNHPKFRRLCHDLAMPTPHVLGHLELMWRVAYESGDPKLGDATDVELAAEWCGDKGVFVECASKVKFLDEVEGVYYVHDLTDHEPEFVKSRRRKEKERKKKSRTVTRRSRDSHAPVAKKSDSLALALALAPALTKDTYLRHVLMTKAEKERVDKHLGSLAESYIERLDGYLEQIGPTTAKAKTYKSHAETILNWWRRDGKPSTPKLNFDGNIPPPVN